MKEIQLTKNQCVQLKLKLESRSGNDLADIRMIDKIISAMEKQYDSYFDELTLVSAVEGSAGVAARRELEQSTGREVVAVSLEDAEFGYLKSDWESGTAFNALGRKEIIAICNAIQQADEGKG